ncbi:hypothetical protein Tco_0754973, partial [Tanacetum coccineum]
AHLEDYQELNKVGSVTFGGSKGSISGKENKHPYLAVSLTKKIFGNMKRGFQGVPRPLLPSMLLVATNPIAGQEHAAQAQTQPLPPPPPIPSPTPTPIPTSTSPPPIIPSPTPTPIPTPTSPPETEPPTDEHIYEEQSPVHHHKHRLQVICLQMICFKQFPS